MNAMESVVKSPVDEFENYTSPIRVLARFFKKSRDGWKEKCIKAKRQIKGLKNQIYQLNKSRQNWKEQAQAQAKEFEVLQAEFEQFKAKVIEPPVPSGVKTRLLRAR